MLITFRFWVMLALAASSSVVMAQSQDPLTQQLQNNPPAPARSQSFAITTAAQPQQASVTGETAPVTATATPTSPIVRNQSAAPSAQRGPTSTVYKPRVKIGEATRMLLAAQARPERRGQDHTVLGVTATRSWERYVESFEHAIPERLENVNTQSMSR